MESRLAAEIAPRSPIQWWIARGQDTALPLVLLASLLVMLVPVPAALMDVLLAANISVAVIMLLSSLYVKTPLEFSVFPSLLLATTLARLVLNVATTRLILTRGESEGLAAAGHVVSGFGQFVAGDNVVVGIVIFAIIVVIQFVVITKGATRISEVAARFALDGMPGRQMGIDADLNAGLIDQREAQARRAEVTRQADFYGAMDGASKFVRGDAVAGIVIVFINIIGGLAIGVLGEGMNFGEASALYTKLTIGDGLVSQVPAFLISLAAGLLVTRGTEQTNLPVALVGQLFSRPQALALTAIFLGFLAFTSLPLLPLLAIGGSCAGGALALTRRRPAPESNAEPPPPTKPAPRIEDYLLVDPMEVEIGVGLVRLADPGLGGDLLERVQRVRQTVAAEMGILMPKVRIRDNMRLDTNQYRIKIHDTAVAQGELVLGMVLALASEPALDGFGGTPSEISGMPGRWIPPARRQQAERLGYPVLEPVAVLTAHLSDVVRQHADEILTRDATKHLLDELKQSAPAAVDELIPDQLSLAQVQQVLQHLLREQVPIRQLGTILEAIGDHAGATKDAVLLAEYVRGRLARTLCARYRDSQGCLHVVTFSPELEERIAAACASSGQGTEVRLPPAEVQQIFSLLQERLAELTTAGHAPVALVDSRVRWAVKRLTEPYLPQLAVLAYQEITRDTRVEAVATISVGLVPNMQAA